jgi:protein TonB
MPRTMFDQVTAPGPAKRPSRWIKAVSLILHLGAALLLFVLPLTAAIDLPGVYTQLPPVMLATVPEMPTVPPPPAVTSPVPSTAPTIPTEAPDRVYEELPPPPTSTGTAPPGALLVGGGGVTVPGIGTVTVAPPAPPPPPQVMAPRRPGGDIKAPERISYKAPTYPPTAQAARIEGTVILEAVIDAQGVVQDVKVLRSVPLLDRAAIEAVQQWRYTPTRLNGVAIPIVMSVTVTFSLR